MRPMIITSVGEHVELIFVEYTPRSHFPKRRRENGNGNFSARRRRRRHSHLLDDRKTLKYPR